MAGPPPLASLDRLVATGKGPNSPHSVQDAHWHKSTGQRVRVRRCQGTVTLKRRSSPRDTHLRWFSPFAGGNVRESGAETAAAGPPPVTPGKGPTRVAATRDERGAPTHLTSGQHHLPLRVTRVPAAWVRNAVALVSPTFDRHLCTHCSGWGRIILAGRHGYARRTHNFWSRHGR